MHTREEARRMIFQVWDNWAGKPDAPNGNDAFRFFTYLQNEKPHLLNFRGRVDKLQDVHGWLIRNGDVTE